MAQKNKGFTLVEILGVIVVLSLLILLSFPTIINQIKNMSSDIDKATKELIFNSTRQYINNNVNIYPIESGYIYCITLQTLVDSGELIEDLTDIKSSKKIDLSKVVKVDIENENNINYSIVKSNDCKEKRPTHVDGSGANPPVLVEGMTPIKWNGVEWVDTTNYDPEWYDYNQKKWANARIKDGSMWVWIPGYAYKITSGYHSNAVIEKPINKKYIYCSI